MRSIPGMPRKLSDAQVEQVMLRHRKRLEFRATYGNICELADRLGVCVSAISYCIRKRNKYLQRPDIVAMMSGKWGALPLVRPRRPGSREKLTNAQRAIVLKWYAAYIESGSERGSSKRFARALGVSGNTFHDCIRRKGVYKQPYRDRKPTTPKGSSKPIRPNGFRRLPRQYLETQIRKNAMQAWKRIPSS